MVRCTAPVRGHNSASAAANCPACSSRGGYGRYSSPSYSSPSYYDTRSSNTTNSGGSAGSSSRSSKPRWSKSTSSVIYTSAEIRTLTPIRNKVEEITVAKPDLRDVFLCHAWDDRKESAKDLHDLLESLGVSVWFSEKDVLLGAPLLRAIDKGLAASKVGIVLVTPSFLNRLTKEGIADKELSVLLATDRLIPIVHGTTYDALRDVSPLLASRSGLDTEEDSLEDVAKKLSELVTISD
ncbi:toll/interleukin-1 receptor domain-containing protein [Priestia flexa]|uniref:toll/interleukin-1 receptor domain-containing protein n=1 Tax=Priestia flexa TaxID=86664 RepID=UPI00209D45BB|nr:toll/interleukin-1 receptor domain-containing protein [Priestia flexa]MCP1191326.1 toll/interleukin-1 receptor domain-containing protein [Priestia flexa]